MNVIAKKIRFKLFITISLMLPLLIAGSAQNIFAQTNDLKNETDSAASGKTEETLLNKKQKESLPNRKTTQPEDLQSTNQRIIDADITPVSEATVTDTKVFASKTTDTILAPGNVRINSSPAPADVVTLKNGDRLTGKIMRSDGKSLLIKTEFAGDVNIVWDAIEEISTSEKVYLILSDGQTLAGTLKTQNGQIEVNTEKAGVVTTAKSAVKTVRSEEEQAFALAEAERLRNPKLWELWEGNFDVGLTLTSGNSRTFNFAMGANAVRETTRDKLSFYFAQIYARDDTDEVSRTTANSIRTGIRYDFKINRKLSAFGFLDIETNELQGLDLRLAFGGGFNYRLIDKERRKLDLFGGISVNQEFFALPDLLPGEPILVDFDKNRTSFELLFGDEYYWKISDRATLKQRAVLFPSMTNFGEFRLNFDTTLSFDLNRRLAWQFTFSDRYLSNPPDGFNKNDVLFATGLRVKFGR